MTTSTSSTSANRAINPLATGRNASTVDCVAPLLRTVRVLRESCELDRRERTKEREVVPKAVVDSSKRRRLGSLLLGMLRVGGGRQSLRMGRGQS